METRKLGTLDVSVVGLGCNNFGGRLDQERTTRVVEAALDQGINFFDTADVYGGTLSEEFVGRALGARRSSVLIATKFGIPLDAERTGGASPAYLRRAVEDSLRRLGTDYIDLYQLHRPDPEVPIADTLGALDDLVRAGKVRQIGCSNFSAEQLREAEASVAPGAARFVSLQNEYSLLQREPERAVLAECERQGVGFLPYFPLASGLLSGKYAPGQGFATSARLADPSTPLAGRFRNEQNLASAQRLASFARGRGHALLDLAFSWLLARPRVASVIAGATSAEQVQANVAAARWRLSADELGEVDRLVPPPA